MAGTFTGWRGDFQGFFLGLQANNSKSYFDSHRRQYEEEVKRPMVALLADLEPEFGPASLSAQQGHSLLGRQVSLQDEHLCRRAARRLRGAGCQRPRCSRRALRD